MSYNIGLYHFYSSSVGGMSLNYSFAPFSFQQMMPVNHKGLNHNELQLSPRANNEDFWNPNQIHSVINDPPFSRQEIIAKRLSYTFEQKKYVQEFRDIVFDARGARGGNGDTAAVFLFVMDMIENLSYKDNIRMVVDERGLKTLSLMTGRLLSSGDTLFSGQVQLISADQGFNSGPPADLYISLARPSGTFKHAFSISKVHLENENDGDLSDWMPKYDEFPVRVNGNTVLLVQTVLGNTENRNSVHPNGLIRLGDRVYDLAAPGFLDEHSGIYIDPVAEKLRGKSKDEVKEILLSVLRESSANPNHAYLQKIIEERRLWGATINFAYGISSKSVGGQFLTYLSGMIEHMDNPGNEIRSMVILTPSGIKHYDYLEKEIKNLRDASEYRKKVSGRIVLITDLSQLPRVAEDGKIYLVHTGNIPHTTFNSLLAYSYFPPIVSGDNALCAAVTIGCPFVMTKVDWNCKNVDAIQGRLKQLYPQGMHLIERIYNSERPSLFGSRMALEEASSLLSPLMRKTFFKLHDLFFSFTENVFSSAYILKKIKEEVDIDLLYALENYSNDFELKLEILVTLANHENVMAQRALYIVLKNNLKLFENLLHRNKLAVATLKYPKIMRLLKKIVKTDLSILSKKAGAFFDKKTFFSGLIRGKEYKFVIQYMERILSQKKIEDEFLMSSPEIGIVFQGIGMSLQDCSYEFLIKLLRHTSPLIASKTLKLILDDDPCSDLAEQGIQILCYHKDLRFRRLAYNQLRNISSSHESVNYGKSLSIQKAVIKGLHDKDENIFKEAGYALTDKKLYMSIVSKDLQLSLIVAFNKTPVYGIRTALEKIPFYDLEVFKAFVKAIEEGPKKEYFILFKTYQANESFQEEWFDIWVSSLERSANIVQNSTSLIERLRELMGSSMQVEAATVIGIKAVSDEIFLDFAEELIQNETGSSKWLQNLFDILKRSEMDNADHIDEFIDRILLWEEEFPQHEKFIQDMLEGLRSDNVFVRRNKEIRKLFKEKLKLKEREKKFEAYYKIWVNQKKPNRFTLERLMEKQSRENSYLGGVLSAIFKYKWYVEYEQMAAEEAL